MNTLKNFKFIAGLFLLVSTAVPLVHLLGNLNSDKIKKEDNTVHKSIISPASREQERRVTKFKTVQQQSTSKNIIQKLRDARKYSNIEIVLKPAKVAGIVRSFLYNVNYSYFNQTNDQITETKTIDSTQKIKVGVQLLNNLTVHVRYSVFQKAEHLQFIDSASSNLDYSLVSPQSVFYSIVASGTVSSTKIDFVRNFHYRAGSGRDATVLHSQKIGFFNVFNSDHWFFGTTWGIVLFTAILATTIATLAVLTKIGSKIRYYFNNRGFPENELTEFENTNRPKPPYIPTPPLLPPIPGDLNLLERPPTPLAVKAETRLSWEEFDALGENVFLSDYSLADDIAWAKQEGQVLMEDTRQNKLALQLYFKHEDLSFGQAKFFSNMDKPRSDVFEATQRWVNQQHEVNEARESEQLFEQLSGQNTPNFNVNDDNPEFAPPHQIPPPPPLPPIGQGFTKEIVNIFDSKMENFVNGPIKPVVEPIKPVVEIGTTRNTLPNMMQEIQEITDQIIKKRDPNFLRHLP